MQGNRQGRRGDTRPQARGYLSAAVKEMHSRFSGHVISREIVPQGWFREQRVANAMANVAHNDLPPQRQVLSNAAQYAGRQDDQFYAVVQCPMTRDSCLNELRVPTRKDGGAAEQWVVKRQVPKILRLRTLDSPRLLEQDDAVPAMPAQQAGARCPTWRRQRNAITAKQTDD